MARIQSLASAVAVKKNISEEAAVHEILSTFEKAQRLVEEAEEMKRNGKGKHGPDSRMKIAAKKLGPADPK